MSDAAFFFKKYMDGLKIRFINYIYIYIAIFCHGTSLKKNIWPRVDSNLRRRSQSTDMLCSKPSCIPKNGCIRPRVKQH